MVGAVGGRTQRPRGVPPSSSSEEDDSEEDLESTVASTIITCILWRNASCIFHALCYSSFICSVT